MKSVLELVFGESGATNISNGFARLCGVSVVRYCIGTKPDVTLQSADPVFSDYLQAINFWRTQNPCRLKPGGWLEFSAGATTFSGLEPADLWAAVAHSIADTSRNLDTARRATFQLCELGRPIGPIHPIDCARLMRKSLRTVYRWRWDAVDQFERQLRKRQLLGE